MSESKNGTCVACKKSGRIQPIKVEVRPADRPYYDLDLQLCKKCENKLLKPENISIGCHCPEDPK